jgi:sugar phosphate isomerase/epimerase
MRYTLTKVLQVAERHQVYIAIEPHQSITRTTQGLLKVATLVNSPFLRVNYDTGNSFLSGEDPYAGLQAVLPLLVHVHAKDIPHRQAVEARGKLTGTPVGCACGEGVIDWARVIGILRSANWSGALSVECGTPQQAANSLKNLSAVLQPQPVAALA